MYGQNFQGTFCYCERGKAYNPETEDEVSRRRWLRTERNDARRDAALMRPVFERWSVCRNTLLWITFMTRIGGIRFVHDDVR